VVQASKTSATKLTNNELNIFLYLKNMDLPKEFFDILYPILIISVGFALVAYMTRKSKNFRSSRNKRAKKQF
jgi:hypothetical protein